MKSLKLALLLLCCSFFYLSPQTSFALPDGSYKASCYNCSVYKNRLRCVCRSRDQRTRFTSLGDFRSCGWIENQDGRLTCRDSVDDRDIPFGSYRKTCVACRYDGKDLRCKCRTRNGLYWQRSILANVDRCRGDISNQNGDLQCSRRGDYTLPAGSYQNTCQSCRNDGNRLTCACRTRDGDYRQTMLRRAYRCRGIENIDGQLVCRR